jgi:hypothetical protein
MTSTAITPVQGKVAAQAGNGFVSIRNGGSTVTCALTAVIPGKGGQRPVGAVIKPFVDVEAAVKAAKRINDGHDKNDPESWSDGRVVPAVQAVGTDGVVDKEATKVALWLRAESIFNWLNKEAEFKKSQASAKPSPAKRQRSA